MTSIRFLSEQVYDTGGPGLGPRFARGAVVSLSDVPAITGGEDIAHCEAWLARWVNRKVAVYVSDDDAAADDGNETGKPEDLSILKKAELEALAAVRGLDVSACRTKADIIAALDAAG